MAEARKARLAEPVPVPSLFAEGADIERGEEYVRLVFWTCLETVEYAPPEQRIVMRAVMPTGVARRLLRDLRKTLSRGEH